MGRLERIARLENKSNIDLPKNDLFDNIFEKKSN